jgi:predicted nucleic acid-binding protein
MILVDTSVWIEHTHNRMPQLVRALDDALVLSHPFVVGELACGGIKLRRKLLDVLGELPPAPIASHAEALAMIEARALMGLGLAYTDVHLLASAAIGDDVQLWTNDKRLAAVAVKLGIGYGERT